MRNLRDENFDLKKNIFVLNQNHLDSFVVF